MGSRKVREGVEDYIFRSGLHNIKQQKCGEHSLYNEMKALDTPEMSRFSGMSIGEAPKCVFQPGGECSSRFEDNSTRKHYEKQLSKIRSELPKEQCNHGLMGCALERKNQALLQFQNAWRLFSRSWEELERRSDHLAKKNEDDEAVKNAQSIMPFEYEQTKYVQPQEFKDLYPSERDSALRDEYVKGSKCINRGVEQKHYCSGQFRTSRLSRSEDGNESEFLLLLNEFGTIHEKFQSLHKNLSALKEEKGMLGLKINKINGDISILEEEKKVLESSLIECKNKEELIQNEMKECSFQLEKLKCELKKCKNLGGVCDVEGQSSAGQKRDAQFSKQTNNSIPEQCKLEIKLLQDIHEEELKLYRLKLAQAEQQIMNLEAQLDRSKSRRAVKNRDRPKCKTQNCVTRENSLVNDGTGYPNQRFKLIGVDKFGKIQDIHNESSIFDSESEKHISRDVDEVRNEFHLESKVRSLILDQFHDFKQEICNVIGKQMKQNETDDKLTILGNGTREVNSLQVVKADDEASTVEQTCDGYMESSVSCKKRNTLDCGVAMAYNFYYGYLKLILPAGISNLGIRGRILKYIKDHGLSDNAFPIKKLILLIPENAYTPHDLQERSVDDSCDGSKYWIQPAKGLEPEIIDRNGWKRDYSLPVYRIKDPDLESSSGDYVVAEFATPVKVFSDMIHKCPVPRISEAFKVYQHQIISSFHKSLVERIRKNDDGCKDLLEIIYYPDTDKNGKSVNIGRIILDRIHLKN